MSASAHVPAAAGAAAAVRIGRLDIDDDRAVAAAEEGRTDGPRPKKRKKGRPAGSIMREKQTKGLSE